jgi:hypothetical protein
MRTTINLDDELLSNAKVVAAREGRTLGDLITDALRVALAARQANLDREPTELPTFDGDGLLPGVDLDDTASLVELMEGQSVPS